MSEVLEKIEVTHGFIEFEVKSANKNSKKLKVEFMKKVFKQ